MGALPLCDMKSQLVVGFRVNKSSTRWDSFAGDSSPLCLGGHLIGTGKECLRDVASEGHFLETFNIYLASFGWGGLQVKQTLLVA